MIKQSSSCKGFTLVELLVSVAIAAFMLTLITVTVSQTVKITRIGTATSRMISKSQVVVEQLSKDFVGQLGPDSKSPPNSTTNPAGFLVIIQQEIADTTEMDNFESVVTREEDDGTGTGNKQPRPVRSDQLLFFYDNDGSTKGGEHSELLSPLCPKASNTFLPADRPSENQACIWYGHLMPTNRKGIAASSTLLGDVNSNTNRSDLWLLGRQVLFMSPTSTSAFYQSVLGVDGTLTYTGAPTAMGTLKFNYGLVDIIKEDHDTILGYVDGQNNAIYQQYVEKVVYGPDNRLWANSIPYFENGASYYQYNSWQIAQTHPILMDNVSDFAIDLAFDTNGDDSVDTYTTGSHINKIKWYSTFPNTNALNGPLTENINSILTSSTSSTSSFRLPFNGTGPQTLVFRHDDDDPTNSIWPMLLRIRFRIHDKNGHLLDPDSKPGIWTEVIVKVNR